MTILGLISDALLLCATIGMALYCRMLSRRLRAFNDVDKGIGGTVATMSLQVDELQKSVQLAHSDADERSSQLRVDIAEADDRIGRLEMLLASLEDIEDQVDLQLEVPETHLNEDVVPSFRTTHSQPPVRFTR